MKMKMMRKKIISIILAMALIFSCMPEIAIIARAAETNEFAGGTGTVEDPYLIATATQLDAIRLYPDQHFKLAEDINFGVDEFYNDGAYWLPIDGFSGSLDGDGHVIDGLKMSRTFSGEILNGQYSGKKQFGLFSNVSGSISNISLINVEIVINVAKDISNNIFVSVGAIAGDLTGTISHCSVSGSISVNGDVAKTSANVGGIVGQGTACVLENCYNSAEISTWFDEDESKVTVGGIVGSVSAKTFSNCINKGNIVAEVYSELHAGGIAGYYSSGMMEECYNLGKVTAIRLTTGPVKYYTYAGGIAGQANNKSIQVISCGNFGEVYAEGIRVAAGGILANGVAGVLVQNCFNSGAISCIDTLSSDYEYHFAAGITGSGGMVDQCFNSGTILINATDFMRAGGIAGASSNGISNSYNAGKVEVKGKETYSRKGGIIAYCAVNVSHCYNVGVVKTPAGAIADYVVAGSGIPAVEDCYYLDNIPNGVNEVEEDNAADIKIETKKCTDTAMKSQTTYAKFDFDNIWTMGSGEYGYPELIHNRHVNPETEDYCSRIGHSIQGHSAKEPTCEEGGWEEYGTCFICGYVKEKKELDAKGHDLEWIIEKDATEEETGIKYEKCKVCDYTQSENTIIDKRPHTHKMSKTEAKKESCLVNGNIEYYICEKCGKVYVDKDGSQEILLEDTVIEATGHTEEELPAIAPKCIETGLTAGTKCSVCNAILVHQEVIGATGHTEEKLPAVGENCTETGLTAGTKCSVCNAILVEQEEIAATGHSYGEWITDKQATCENDGSRYRKCVNCNHIETECINKREHVFSENWIIDRRATMEANGIMSKHCIYSDCLAKDYVCTIKKADVVKLSVASVVYDGKAKNPKVIITDSDGEAIDSSNYIIISPAECKNAGKYTFTVKFQNQYEGSKKLTYTIQPKKITGLTLSKITYIYNGKAKKPTVTVKVSGKTLSAGISKDTKNIDITYAAGRTKVGKYKVTVKGKGNYTGTLSKTFVINPKATSVTKLTIGSKSITVKWKKISAQVSGYQIRYAKKSSMANAKTIKVAGYSKISRKIAGLSNAKYYVQVRTYKTVNGTNYYSSWSAKKSATVLKDGLNKNVLRIRPGVSVQLKVNNYTGKVTWSSNSDGVTVTKKGLVKGKYNTTAKVTAKLANGKKYKCTVYVGPYLEDVKIFLRAGTSMSDVVTIRIENYSDKDVEIAKFGDYYPYGLMYPGFNVEYTYYKAKHVVEAGEKEDILFATSSGIKLLRDKEQVMLCNIYIGDKMYSLYVGKNSFEIYYAR